jgi:hypothetical protein
MSETPQEYTNRILANVADSNPLEVLTSTGPRLRQLVSGRSDSELSQQPQPGRWSVREILAHLADCEVVAGWRIRSILATNGTTVQPFDQNRWAEAFRYQDAPVAESLDLFDVSRRANLRLFRAADPDRLENFGMHQERGRESIGYLIRLYAGHDLNHLTQIEGLLEKRR